MKKISFFLLQLACVFAVKSYAADTTNGYIISIYGNALKSSYGECVHTAYYEAGVDGRAECGDLKEEASAPVKVPKVVVETVSISDADKVLFNFNAATLTSDGIAEITAFAKKLGAQPDITSIIIDGYTDSIGKTDYNVKLSTERAEAVKQFFVQNGVKSDLITTHGYGEKDAKSSAACISKFGSDDFSQIWQLEAKLNSTKGKSKKTLKEKKQLQTKLHELETKRTGMITCVASDRRVVFTIEHTRQVEKTVTENALAPISEPQAKPPLSGQ